MGRVGTLAVNTIKIRRITVKYTRKSRALAAKSRAVQAQIQCIQMCFSSHFYFDSSYLNGIARKGMPLLYTERLERLFHSQYPCLSWCPYGALRVSAMRI